MKQSLIVPDTASGGSVALIDGTCGVQIQVLSAGGQTIAQVNTDGIYAIQRWINELLTPPGRT